MSSSTPVLKNSRLAVQPDAASSELVLTTHASLVRHRRISVIGVAAQNESVQHHRSRCSRRARRRGRSSEWRRRSCCSQRVVGATSSESLLTVPGRRYSIIGGFIGVAAHDGSSVQRLIGIAAHDLRKRGWDVHKVIQVLQADLVEKVQEHLASVVAGACAGSTT